MSNWSSLPDPRVHWLAGVPDSGVATCVLKPGASRKPTGAELTCQHQNAAGAHLLSRCYWMLLVMPLHYALFRSLCANHASADLSTLVERLSVAIRESNIELLLLTVFVIEDE
ncbi:hypothetical protein C8J57DRAFT_1216904 [Mycena rebaudengoi]|nr:hypothetical protein C8J57DRAFT_1216904 [Mycena rebaudengoi]